MSNDLNNSLPFRPVLCNQSNIEMVDPIDGYVYFAIDSKKIFLGANNKFLPMGGNSGIYYGTREFSDEEIESEETTFIFSAKEDIEGDQTPNPDDLILNSDGSFFRVISVYGDEVKASRVAVSGTGGGEGGGGQTSSKPVVSLTEIGDQYFRYSDADNMKIYFTCSSLLNDGINYISEISYSFGNASASKTGHFSFGEVIEFNIAEYLRYFEVNNRSTLKIQVTDAYGNTSKTQYAYFYLIDISLKQVSDPIIKLSTMEAKLGYRCVPSGGTSLSNKEILINIAPKSNPTVPIYTEKRKVSTVDNIESFNIDFTEIEGIEHGIYLLTAQYYGETNPNSLANKVIPSNILTTQIAYYDINVGDPLIVTDFNDSTILQYDNFSLNYMIVDEKNTNIESVVKIYYGSNYSSEQATLNTINNWSLTFINTGVYEIAIEYNNILYSLGYLTINVYEGEIPTINPTSLELYLTAMGKSNTQADKDIWGYNGHYAKFENFLWGNENGWVKDADDNPSLKLTNGAKLTLPDYFPFATKGSQYGLTIEIDFTLSGILDYTKPLISCISYDSNGLPECGININGQKATLNSAIYKATSSEIQGDGGSSDEADQALQSLTQYFNENTRIHLTYIIPYRNNKNDTYFVYTLLNGVLSGIMKFDSSDEFQSGKASFVFDSTYGDIYLHNLRVYRDGKSFKDIIHNYIADLSDIEEKIALYKDNNIFTANAQSISYKAVSDISYLLNVPYVLLKGGCKMKKKASDGLSFESNYQLPVAKDDYRLMSMQMYKTNKATNTKELVYDVPIEVIDNETNEVLSNFLSMEEGKTYTPVRGINVYGQGTSSMVYPVKNLRFKFIEENDFPVVYDGSCPVEIVCLKADFMDSSSSHNTATGNLVYDLYNKLTLKTPPQKFQQENKNKDGVFDYDLVTAIRGYPIIVFYAEGDSDDYTFVGRYNFNLDKATPEPFGFGEQWFYTGNETSTGRKEVKAVGLMTEEVEGMTVLPLDDEGNEIVRNIVQCWEFLNNDNNSPTKFLTSEGYVDFYNELKSNWIGSYEDRYPDEFVDIFKTIASGEEVEESVLNNYNEDVENGLFRMARWVNSTSTKEASNKPLEEPVYGRTLDAEYDSSKTYYDNKGSEVAITFFDVFQITNAKIITNSEITPFFSSEQVFKSKLEAEGILNIGNYSFIYSIDDNNWYYNGNIVDLSDYGIGYTGTPQNLDNIIATYKQENDWTNLLYEKYDTDSKNYRLSKFKTEFNQYFDLEFTAFYYILTMVLLMMDSRAKNMMLASWDQKIWYPIFYDMDTMLGINNTGYNKFGFEVEDDPSDYIFNGHDSVLWNNFRDCFYETICESYSKMRNNGLTLTNLLKIYNENNADAWNEAICTSDAIYKYERPFKEKYWNGTDEVWVQPGTRSYLYASQGKRSNHRAWWISNRLNYLDSKYLPFSYGSLKPSDTNTFQFRAYSLPEQQNNDRAQICVNDTPVNLIFNITALSKSYQSLMIGTTVYGPVAANAGETVQIGPDSGRHEVEAWILNPTLIADLGDLSDKYLGQLNFPNGVTTRLTELNFGRSSRSAEKFGYGDKYKTYYNTLLSEINMGDSCPYLQKLNIARCEGLKNIDLRKNNRLVVVDAEKSKLTNINFPENSILQEVYLPSTLTRLSLINQPHLKTLVIDEPTAETPFNIRTIILEDLPLLNTYNLVDTIFSSEDSINYKLLNVNWINNNINEPGVVNEVLTTITLLDNIQNSKNTPEDNLKPYQAVSGELIIDIPNCSISEYDIYAKYASAYPSLNISYGENIDKDKFIKAKHITFMGDEKGNNPKAYYNVLSNGLMDLEFLTSASGPKGTAMGIPSKPSTIKEQYRFTHRWIDDLGIEYYDSTIDIDSLDLDKQQYHFSNFVPNSDLVLYPVYETQIRQYMVKFYEDSKTVILQNEEEYHLVNYGETYDGPMVNYWYKDDSLLGDSLKYDFIGWTTEYYPNQLDKRPAFFNLETDKVQGLTMLYPYFEKVAANQKAARTNEYFEAAGNRVIVKNKYYNVLKGKVVIPNIEGCTGIGAGGNTLGMGLNNATHIYFEEGSAYDLISSYAFSNASFKDSKLVYVELPETIKTVEGFAFASQSGIQNLNLNDNIEFIGDRAFQGCSFMIKKLPDNLTHIAEQAFLGNTGIAITTLPAGLTEIRYNVFKDCPNIQIAEFPSNIVKFGARAFQNSGTGLVSIVFMASSIEFEDDSFDGYSKNTLSNIYLVGLEEDYETIGNAEFPANAAISYGYQKEGGA